MSYLTCLISICSLQIRAWVPYGLKKSFKDLGLKQEVVVSFANLLDLLESEFPLGENLHTNVLRGLRRK